MWKWIVVLIVIVVVIGAAWAASTRSQPVEAAAARRAPIAAYVEERARTRLPKVDLITMPIEGRILPIELVEGDPVVAGQVVARLDVDDLDTAVQMAGARVRRLEASIVENNDTRLERSTLTELDSFLESVDRSVEASQAETESSKARLDYHVFDRSRKQEAFESQAASMREVEEAQLSEIESRVDWRTDVLALRALEAIRRAVQIWPIQVRQMIEKKDLAEAVLTNELAEARAALEQAKRDRGRADITSPVDGVVLHRAVASRRTLPAGELLLEIGRMDLLEIEVEVLSQDAVNIAVGDPVEIFMPAVKHDPLRGTVARVEPRGFTKISSLGVEQQRVLVIVVFEPGELRRFEADGFNLGVGYRLRVRIVTDRRQGAVVVPRAALFRGAGDQWQVFVVTGGRARLTDVRLGLLNDREAEIVSGLEPGAMVILAPESDLADGARVTRTVGDR